MKTPEQTRDKPSRIIFFVIPGALTILFVASSEPQPRSLFDVLALGAFFYSFSLIFLLAGWHGFSFVRSLFRSRGGDSQ